jgi:hypothetical protein
VFYYWNKYACECLDGVMKNYEWCFKLEKWLVCKFLRNFGNRSKYLVDLYYLNVFVCWKG